MEPVIKFICNMITFIHANKNQLEDVMKERTPFKGAKDKVKCLGRNVAGNV